MYLLGIPTQVSKPVTFTTCAWPWMTKNVSNIIFSEPVLGFLGFGVISNSKTQKNLEKPYDLFGEMCDDLDT
jgi:hypothetical protein